jgi:hypothetical protein
MDGIVNVLCSIISRLIARRAIIRIDNLFAGRITNGGCGNKQGAMTTNPPRWSPQPPLGPVGPNPISVSRSIGVKSVTVIDCKDS